MSRPDRIRVSRPAEFTVEEMPWGRLVWQVSGEQGNSDVLTTGRCILAPGQANGRHVHPTCDEVLEVLSGSIVHTWDDREVAMERGDVISIPAGVVHNARNVGDGEAELLIVFSTGHRTAEAAD
ncbi:MAG TPA: cupin domain-containing protein [Solirubrobacteraceae bacterium]|nr:cupin domain-containing protein [Solirubrobacteraceae bacterium]